MGVLTGYRSVNVGRVPLPGAPRLGTYSAVLDRSEVSQRAKELLVDGLRLEVSPEDVADDEPIFGTELGLDSIDVLEFVVLVEQEFGVVISDESVVRQAFSSISALTNFILTRPEVSASA